MKKYILALLAASLLALLCPMPTLAQWDYGQDSTWNMIEHRAAMRRMEARMKARREAEKKQRAKTAKSSQGKGKASAGSAKAGTTAKKGTASAKPMVATKRGMASAKPMVATKKVEAPVKSYGVWFYRDTFQDINFQDGYRVNLDFVSTATGKTFQRFAYYDTWNDNEDIWDVPAGTYTIRAEAIQKGKKYPVHLAIIRGSREKAPFETFAPSLKIQLKPIVTRGGKYVPDDEPLQLYVRVIGQMGQ